MRYLICLFALLICDVTFAQDPTVPSAQILERLKLEKTAPVAALLSTEPAVREPLALPVLKLKAVVMTDRDHGTALIEVDGRRVRLRLSREATKQLSTPESSAEIGLDGVVIQGSTYHVQTFSARSILLTNDSQTLLVQ